MEQKLAVWLWALVYGQGLHQLQPADLRACEELKEQLQRWGVLSPHAVGHSHDNWEGEVTLLLGAAERQRVACVTQARDSMEKYISSSRFGWTPQSISRSNMYLCFCFLQECP